MSILRPFQYSMVDRIKVAKFRLTRLRWVRQTGLGGRASSWRLLLAFKPSREIARRRVASQPAGFCGSPDLAARGCFLLLTGRESVHPIVSAVSSAGPLCFCQASHAGAETPQPCKDQRLRETHRSVPFQPPQLIHHHAGNVGGVPGKRGGEHSHAAAPGTPHVHAGESIVAELGMTLGWSLSFAHTPNAYIRC